ncbi:MAG TPA: hypothetical protein VLK84_02240 [Longimicrobium sp.]|nr:hypothetical protein [Longimicrobium sp.]
MRIAPCIAAGCAGAAGGGIRALAGAVYFAHFVAVRILANPGRALQMETSYPAPVNQLLSLGMPTTWREGWLDYRGMGLSDEHVPSLIQMMEDPSLEWDAMDEDADETPYWAPVHAWRALGQLRAEAAVEPLLGVLHRDEDNDWAMSEIPDVLGMIGPAALGPVRDALARAARHPDPWEGGSLGTALEKIAQGHPEARDEAVSVLTHQLKGYGAQDPELNAFLVTSLVELHAVEAAPFIEAAFVAGAVDESVSGDWEDIQVELGLLAERTTPKPRYRLGFDLPDLPRSVVRRDPPPVHPAARASQLRKKQKQASRRRRK